MMEGTCKDHPQYRNESEKKRKNEKKKLLRIKRKKEIENEKLEEKQISHLLLNSLGQQITRSTLVDMYIEAYPVQHQVDYSSSGSIKKLGEDAATFMGIIKNIETSKGTIKRIKDIKTCHLVLGKK